MSALLKVSILYSLEEIHSPHLRSKEPCSTSARAEYLHNYLEFFYIGHMSLPPHLYIDPIIHLRPHGYIFYIALKYNTTLFTFLLKLFQPWPWALSVGFVSLSHTPTVVGPFVCLTSSSTFLLLALQQVPGLSCIFSDQPYKSLIFPRIPSSFYCRVLLKPSWGCKVCLLLWNVIASESLSWQSNEVQTCTLINQSIDTYIYISFLYIHISICNHLYPY